MPMKILKRTLAWILCNGILFSYPGWTFLARMSYADEKKPPPALPQPGDHKPKPGEPGYVAPRTGSASGTAAVEEPATNGVEACGNVDNVARGFEAENKALLGDKLCTAGKKFGNVPEAKQCVLQALLLQKAGLEVLSFPFKSAQKGIVRDESKWGSDTVKFAAKLGKETSQRMHSAFPVAGELQPPSNPTDSPALAKFYDQILVRSLKDTGKANRNTLREECCKKYMNLASSIVNSLNQEATGLPKLNKGDATIPKELAIPLHPGGVNADGSACKAATADGKAVVDGKETKEVKEPKERPVVDKLVPPVDHSKEVHEPETIPPVEESSSSSKKTNWIPWAIGGVIVGVIAALLLKKKDKPEEKKKKKKKKKKKPKCKTNCGTTSGKSTTTSTTGTNGTTGTTGHSSSSGSTDSSAASSTSTTSSAASSTASSAASENSAAFSSDNPGRGNNTGANTTTTAGTTTGASSASVASSVASSAASVSSDSYFSTSSTGRTTAGQSRDATLVPRTRTFPLLK